MAYVVGIIVMIVMMSVFDMNQVAALLIATLVYSVLDAAIKGAKAAGATADGGKQKEKVNQ